MGRRCWSGPTCAAPTRTASSASRATSIWSRRSRSTPRRTSASSARPARPWCWKPTARRRPSRMTRAMSEAMDCARKVACRLCAARNVTHTGAIGYFAVQAAEAGFIGIAMSASGPMMTYPGTQGAGGVVESDRLRGAAQERPAVSARFLHRRRRQRQDHGRDGPRREDSRSAGVSTRMARTPPIRRRSRTLLPLGGAKGAGLSFMIECLTSLLLSASARRAGPGKLGDRRRSVPQRHGDRDRHRRRSAIRDRFGARPSGSARPSRASPAPTA